MGNREQLSAENKLSLNISTQAIEPTHHKPILGLSTQVSVLINSPVQIV